MILITILHVMVCAILMLSVLLQSGKGGGMGSAFGGGSTGTVFGGSGAGGFLRKLTVAAAVIFMLTSMSLAWLGSRTGSDALLRYAATQRHARELEATAHQEAMSKDGDKDQTKDSAAQSEAPAGQSPVEPAPSPPGESPAGSAAPGASSGAETPANRPPVGPAQPGKGNTPP